MKALDTKTETEVVAYIARGDSYNTILKTLEDKGFSATKGTLTNIKKRNSEALEYMQTAMQEQQLSHATTLLRKSRQLLERKLDQSLELDNDLDKLKKLYDNDEIDFDQYSRRLDVLLRKELSATELNSITKESFNQSQVEQGKPSSITENPTQARANLAKLLNAISTNDERAAMEAIFLDA